jgi:hypothetical protein
MVPFSSSFFHLVINRLDTAGFSDLLASYSIYFVLPTIFLSTFTSIASNICLLFYISALVTSAYVIIGRTVTFYIFDFVSFLLYLFLLIRSFKLPATLAAFTVIMIISNNSVFNYDKDNADLNIDKDKDSNVY